MIIYEKLNLFTLLLSIAGRIFFTEQYFIRYSPFIKRHLTSFIKTIGLRQIHFIHFLGRGVQVHASEKAIEFGKKAVKDNPLFSGFLIKYTNDARAADLARQTFVQSAFPEIYIYTCLEEFINDRNDKMIYYFAVSKNLILRNIANISRNITAIRWHLIVLNAVDLMKRCAAFLCLIFAPFVLLIRLLWQGKVTLVKDIGRSVVKKKTIFFHRYEMRNVEYTAFYKDMYLFKNDILKIGDCIHTCLKGPFSKEKASYLEKGGGAVLDYYDQKIHLRRIMTRLFRDYYRYIFQSKLSFNGASDPSLIRYTLMFISMMVKFEQMLDSIDVELAFFESELYFIPSVFTIVANKRNIKTMTMLHGMASYCRPDHNRSNMVVNYYIVPSNNYDELLKRDNPHIDKLCPIGLPETEEPKGKGAHTKGEGMSEEMKTRLEYLKRRRIKVIGMFYTFAWPFFQGAHVGMPLFDKEDSRKAFLYYWGAFFEWVKRRNDIFILFKGKSSHKDGSHPFFKEVIKDIPDDRYYRNDELQMREAIPFCDCVISGPYHESSPSFTAWAMGVPVIDYDIVGFVGDDKVARHITARTPDELIMHLETILKDGFPDDFVSIFRKTHHVSDGFGDNVSLRINDLITKITEGELREKMQLCERRTHG